MNSIDDIAPRLTGEKEKTFRYETVCNRWPAIVTRVIDHFSTRRAQLIEEYGEEAATDIQDILASISEVHYRMATDKPLYHLFDRAEDVTMWNELLRQYENEVGQPNVTWFKSRWLFAECYMYRLLYSFVVKTRKLKSYDYFFHQKISAYQTHADQIILGIEDVNSYIALGSDEESKRDSLMSLLQICLWGNRSDLSLSGGIASLFDESSKDLKERDKYILINQLPEVIDYLLNVKAKSDEGRRIDIILDNSGVELAGDLAFADYLATMGLVDKIVFHGKKIPWFVSDTTEEDFKWTVDAIAQLKKSDGTIREDCVKFSKRISERLESGFYEFKSETFWTSPFPYTEMQARAPELYEYLGQSSLIVFKGDLNYRKLVDDRDWNYETPLKEAIGDFNLVPFLALRTLKSETVVGLDRNVVDHVLSRYGDDYKWMTTGTYAVASFYTGE